MRTTPKVIKSLLLIVGGGIFAWTYRYGDAKEFFLGILSVLFFSALYVIYDISSPEPKLNSPRAILVYRILLFSIAGVFIIGSIFMAIALMAQGQTLQAIRAIVLSAVIAFGAQQIWKNALTQRSSGTPQKRGAP